MSESYTVGGDTNLRINGGERAGQTFSPVEAHTLHFIDLQMMRWGKKGSVTVELYNTDASGLPTGIAISKSLYIVYPVKPITYWGRQRFKMTPIDVYPGGVYAIIAYPTPADPPIPFFLKYDAGDATYPRGERIFSTNDGATWTKYPLDDHIFVEFGDPPSPPPLPDPPVKNFIITMWEQIQLYDGFRIKSATSVPIHQYVYWTCLRPKVHRITEIKRGLPKDFSQYFCYGVWHTTEQNEEGDTLYHTFDITGWEEYEIRWLITAGKIDEEKSPSIGPIVEKFNSLPTTPQGFFSTPPYKCHVGASMAWYKVTLTDHGLIKDLLPSNAVCAFIHFRGATGYRYFGLRPTGSSHAPDAPVGGLCQTWAMVKLDSEKSFEALLHRHLYQEIYIIGYATDQTVVMFDEPLDRTSLAGDAWQTVDLAADCPNALGIMCEFARNIDVFSYGIRPYGSTDNRIKGLGHSWYLIGCSPDQKIDYYPDEKSGRVSKLYILGYVKKSAAFFTNSIDKSLTVTDSYQLVSPFPLTSLAFLEAYSPLVSAKIACRAWGSTDDIYMNPAYRRCFVIAPLYPEDKFEYKIENLNSDLYLFGTGV